MRADQRKRIKDYRDTFKTAEGQRVLADMYASYCGPVFNSDALEMSRREGRREVVLSILRLLGMENRMFELEREDDE